MPLPRTSHQRQIYSRCRSRALVTSVLAYALNGSTLRTLRGHMTPQALIMTDLHMVDDSTPLIDGLFP